MPTFQGRAVECDEFGVYDTPGKASSGRIAAWSAVGIVLTLGAALMWAWVKS